MKNLCDVCGVKIEFNRNSDVSVCRHVVRMEKRIHPSWQKILLDEKFDVSVKLEKLQTFVCGSIYSSVPPEEQSRINRQLLIMQLYEQVLLERIAALKQNQPTL